MNQERFVQVPSKVLESLLSMASAHVGVVSENGK